MIIVSALAKNRVIGLNGNLPWHIPSELEWFRQLTLGNVVIMGRGTWDGGIPKPLRSRDNWVVTSRAIEGIQPDEVFGSVTAAIEAARLQDKKVFIIGGGQVFEQCLPFVDEMYLTHVDLEPEGDSFFPEFDHSDWEAEILTELNDPVPYRVVWYKRR